MLTAFPSAITVCCLYFRLKKSGERESMKEENMWSYLCIIFFRGMYLFRFTVRLVAHQLNQSSDSMLCFGQSAGLGLITMSVFLIRQDFIFDYLVICLVLLASTISNWVF